jgi:hypothetical protein
MDSEAVPALLEAPFFLLLNDGQYLHIATKPLRIRSLSQSRRDRSGSAKFSCVKTSHKALTSASRLSLYSRLSGQHDIGMMIGLQCVALDKV